MALKGDRLVDATEIGYFCNEVAERGNLVVVATAGSGVALDSYINVCTVAASSSGRLPLGVLLQDVVSIDRTRTPINWYKDQAASGDKVSILTKGWVVTNRIFGTPSGGMTAVLNSSGTISAASEPIVNIVANPKIGRFRSGLSEEGYARVYVDL